MSLGRALWFNGRMVDPTEPHVTVDDHGLLYGDGIFEGIRFYGGVPFRLDAHLARLERSARAVHMDLPYSRHELTDVVRQAARTWDGGDGYMRLVVTRGQGGRGVDPSTCPRPNVFLLIDQLPTASGKPRSGGASLVIAATRRLAVDQLDPRIKSLNYLNQVLAKVEANQAGADEAIILNRDGFIAEGTVDNLFIVDDGVLLTPPVTDGALDGITRGVIIELAEREQIPCREQRLAVYDLLNADECFLTGTGVELIPVARVQDRPIGTGVRPVFERLEGAFRKLIGEETARDGAAVATASHH